MAITRKQQLRAGKAQGGDTVYFKAEIAGTLHEFKMVCGPGDDAAPVLMLMLLDED